MVTCYASQGTYLYVIETSKTEEKPLCERELFFCSLNYCHALAPASDSESATIWQALYLYSTIFARDATDDEKYSPFLSLTLPVLKFWYH